MTIARFENITINNLLPGFHETDRSITTMKAMAEKNGTTPEAMKAERIGHIPAARIGDPAEGTAVQHQRFALKTLGRIGDHDFGWSRVRPMRVVRGLRRSSGGGNGGGFSH